MPFHIEAERHWTTRSWDRTQIPKPFSNVALALGPPIDVPGHADADLLEMKRVELEVALNRLAGRATAMLAEE